ncbi:unnamed protein product [Mytilus edulis]|uniref:MAM domain-containing protein n=1 Tax=Mytilus edulis TaxID=6550 RepID=A0A8S3UAA6_MYTED|nr:unnamed protein product [Mytilus edulis]
MGRLNVSFNNNYVWSQYGDKGDTWNIATIDIDPQDNFSFQFVGIYGSGSACDIAIDDVLLLPGSCSGLSDHKIICADLDKVPAEKTYCPKGYLDFTSSSLIFEPEKMDFNCSEIYHQTKTRLETDCRKGNDSQRCVIDLSTDIRSHPECFQLNELRILHTCDEFEDETTTFSTDSKSREAPSSGLVVGLVIGVLLLVCVVIVIIVLIRRYTFRSDSKEQIKNNLEGNDYIGSQDIALSQTANHSRHMQNIGIYEGSNNSRVDGHDNTNVNAHINNVQHEYAGAVNGLVNNGVQVPTYAYRQDKTFADNHMSNDDVYATADPTAETSFNENLDDRTETADSYMVLDPTQTGFNRQILSTTPVGYEFAKPVRDTENKIIEDDQYAISDGVYDHSGNNCHKESENNIYNHTVDTIYDSGSHKRNEEEKEDTYDHFFGQTTEDDYDISTST